MIAARGARGRFSGQPTQRCRRARVAPASAAAELRRLPNLRYDVPMPDASAESPSPADAAFRRFLQRVWQHDVVPLLRDRRAGQRRTTARVGGKLAAAGGLLVDSLFRLRGRPFARFMTVMGSRLGAMLPDLWDWRWLRESADAADRAVLADQLGRRAAELPEADALALFGLAPTATADDLRDAWRAAAARWHPDKAATDAERREHQVRFVAYQAAYDRLATAYAAGALPVHP